MIKQTEKGAPDANEPGGTLPHDSLSVNSFHAGTVTITAQQFTNKWCTYCH